MFGRRAEPQLLYVRGDSTIIICEISNKWNYSYPSNKIVSWKYWLTRIDNIAFPTTAYRHAYGLRAWRWFIECPSFLPLEIACPPEIVVRFVSSHQCYVLPQWICRRRVTYPYYIVIYLSNMYPMWCRCLMYSPPPQAARSCTSSPPIFPSNYFVYYSLALSVGTSIAEFEFPATPTSFLMPSLSFVFSPL